jgi:biopolymer transport protein ExbD
MSHGPSTEGSKAEPNLVPLLDVVLQLIMFFMLTVNFVNTEQINQAIVLPEAQSAVPLDKTVKDVLFLNMDKEGKILLVGERPDTRTKEGRSKIKSYLNKEKARAQRLLAANKKEADSEKYMVVLRAHKAAKCKDVMTVLQLCEEAGYRRWQLRVQSKA